MMCQHCVATVTKVLKAMDDVTDAVVDLDGQKADVSADKAISAEDFKKSSLLLDIHYKISVHQRKKRMKRWKKH